MIRGFWSYKQINEFSRQKFPFLPCFWCRNSPPRNLSSPKLACMTLSFIVMLSLKLGLTVFSNYKQINAHLSR